VNTGLYPILTLLCRLDVDSIEMKPFQSLVQKCMGCKIWKIRAMAARCLPCVVDPDFLTREIEDIFAGFKTNNQNELHGGLMGLQRLAEYYSRRHSKEIVFGLILF
jgi:hypothetical protein